MSTQMTHNSAYLRGSVDSPPVFSHESYGRSYFLLTLGIQRLSGARDIIRVLANRETLHACHCAPGRFLTAEGSLRSFNNRTGVGSKLVITVLAHTLSPGPEAYENKIFLSGALCKPPIYRQTPLGREICDIILAVGRSYGRSDYLPCIAWGAGARQCARRQVGDRLAIEGRIQSRTYIKVFEDNTQTRRVAYEVSVNNLLPEAAAP
ncbi:MAG: single-stranded DNA-binding protein [Oscillospiraceae bacterium]|jgi:primosomal replication protein N|nr:single-stranded DNA-binding protein [Oscillospiraceae bacterium]